MASGSDNKTAAYAALAIAAWGFGSNWIVGRGLADEVPPAATAFWRWFAACLPLAPFCIAPIRRDAALIRRSWRKLVLLGILGVGFFQLFIYWGLRYTTATNGALLNSAVPMLIIVISTLAYGTRFTWSVALGVLVSAAGVVMIIVRGDASALAALQFNPGDLLILVAMVFWALYSIQLRTRPAGLHDLSFLGATFAVGLVMTGVMFAIEMALGYRGRYSPQVIAQLAWIGLVPSLLAYFCWNFGVKRIGAARAGVFAHLIPVFAAAMAIAFLGEELQAYHFLGFALVLGGIALSNRRADIR